MKLIVGLGNPGDIYRDSRHNIGFSVVKALSQSNKILLKKEKDAFSLSGKGRIGGQNVILAEPLTFMNLSGIAVSTLLRKYRINLDNLLVVLDDLDLELGRLKIRASGSCAGHRGLESIIEDLESSGFARLRIGIGRPHQANNIDTREYVLSGFTNKEKKKVKEAVFNASNCCEVWLAKGVDEAMNIFNRRSNDNE